MAPDIIGGNVHSGVTSPWLEGPEGHETHIQVERGLQETTHVSSLSISQKSSKLNPKRVGAAWAEKRKRELEMEKRGDIATSSYDDNWLPEFGRVWQTGSRKESRREFEKEKQKGSKIETLSELSLKVQPYVSKRMVCTTSALSALTLNLMLVYP